MSQLLAERSGNPVVGIANVEAIRALLLARGINEIWRRAGYVAKKGVHFEKPRPDRAYEIFMRWVADRYGSPIAYEVAYSVLGKNRVFLDLTSPPDPLSPSREGEVSERDGSC